MPEPRPANAVPRPDNAVSQAALQVSAQECECVQAWLAARVSGARAIGASMLLQYRVEAERVCWYARAVGKPTVSWQRDGASVYLRFLQGPPTWAVSARGIERDDTNWTPLHGPLSARSARQSNIIAANLRGWLQRAGYLRANPFLDDDAFTPTMPAPSAPAARPVTASRSDLALYASDMTLMIDATCARAVLGREARLRQVRDYFLAVLLAQAGMHVSELMFARIGDVVLHAVSASHTTTGAQLPPSVWLLAVSTGRMQRWLPCDALMSALREYRTTSGLSPLPLPNEAIPLLLSARKRSPRRADGTIIDSPALRRDFGERRGIASRSQLLLTVKAMLGEAAEYARAIDHADATVRLTNASLRSVRGAHLRERPATGEATADVAHAPGLAALSSASVRARDADLVASIVDAARRLTLPST